ncbi:hypothetical protein [Brevundimonas albigilva]|jgi:hypothetical protein|uniref:Uncharacterized protein n=1 Tax=Brevundimonas albigilva TaxID=1312364 RepID=A0ABY4SJD0_9CAUL|nr:hypothetical protein [Brevundimonas albigilva]URI14338.1 hypothetical protein M8231_10945 [Brevundimonas albigilva]
MQYAPLQRRLADHLLGRPDPSGAQEVFVGTRAVDDGWVVALLRIDGCTSEEQAAWFGSVVQGDLHAHLRHANQEDVSAEAVQVEWAVPAGGVGWSVAIFVTLGSMAEAMAVAGFLKEYAAPTAA